MNAQELLKFRRYQSGDENGVLALYRNVFNTTMTAALWRWKFMSDLDGPTIVCIAEDQGRIVGQGASVMRNLFYNGETRLAFQGTDIMVSQEYRGQKAQRGLLLELGKYGKDIILRQPSCAFTYFVSTQSQQKASEPYRGTFHFNPLSNLSGYSPGPSSDISSPRCTFFLSTALAGFDAEDEKLWRSIASEIGWSTDRTARYLNWRYRDMPEVKYEVIRLSNEAGLQGIMILHDGWREEWISATGKLAVVDMFFADERFLRAGLSYVADLGRKRNREPFLWLSSSHQTAHTLSAAGWQKTDLEPRLVGAIGPTWELSVLRSSAYQLIGDSDWYGLDRD